MVFQLPSVTTNGVMEVCVYPSKLCQSVVNQKNLVRGGVSAENNINYRQLEDEQDQPRSRRICKRIITFN